MLKGGSANAGPFFCTLASVPVEGTKVRFLGPGASAEESWRRLAKTVLGLDEARADRMLEALPRNVVLAGASVAARDRIAKQLARESIPADLVPDPVRGDACAAHPRALVSEECPRCHERMACALCLYAEAAPQCAACAHRSRFWTRFRHVRVGILLAILAVVVWNTYGTKWRLQNWSRPVSVAIYPVAAEPGADVSAWTAAVGESSFVAVVRRVEDCRG